MVEETTDHDGSTRRDYVKSDSVNATWGGERYGPLWNSYLERLPDVSVDWKGLPNSFPEIPVDEQLSGHQRVAEIIDGDV